MVFPVKLGDQMIKKYVSDISEQMGIKLSRISLIDGRPLGCIDVQMLNLSAEGHVVSALIFQADIDNLKQGNRSDSLEVRIRVSLSRLQLLMKPRLLQK